jgi:hypothetical protein
MSFHFLDGEKKYIVRNAFAPWAACGHPLGGLLPLTYVAFLLLSDVSGVAWVALLFTAILWA